MKTFKISKFKVDKWRKLKEIEFDIANKITLISGHNGVGKSNLLSLIASTSGTKQYVTNSGRRFHPEIYEYFIIDKSEMQENYTCYSIYNVYDENSNIITTFTKRLRLKDDTSVRRGIRIIPETYKYPLDSDDTIISFQERVKEEIDIGREQRVPVPTYFLSLSRLHPLGESNAEFNIMNSNANVITKQGNDKFREWYNYVLEDSIENDSLYKINKLLHDKKASKNSYYMDIKDTTPLTQSVGQDNLSNIISVLVDFYIISKDSNYTGGILCIDEIDVSLHPNAQIRLINLLSKVAEELNLQIIISSHSLIIMKEILRLNNRCSNDFKLVYLKNADNPFVSQFLNYKALEADLFQEQNEITKPKIKIYFEDNIGLRVFNLLKHTLSLLANNPTTQDDFKEIVIDENIHTIEAFIGCDTFRRLIKCDKYFETVCIILDGDARIKDVNKRNNCDNMAKKTYNKYLMEDVNPSDYSLFKNSKEGDPRNLIYLPNYFPPEFYLYRIIYQYVIYEGESEYFNFWRSLDINPETTRYTPQFLRNHLIIDINHHINLDDPLIIDNLKNSERINLMLDFCESSNILVNYYSKEKNKKEFINFWKDFSRVIEYLKAKNYARYF